VDAGAADRAPQPFATWPELRALASSGLVDVQSHTWSHSMIFTGETVIGRTTSALAEEPMLNRPRVDESGPPEFLTPDRTGYPLFQRRSRMSDARRFFPDPAACAALETSGDPESAPPFAGALRGRWERDDEQVSAIESELSASRSVLEDRLRQPVRHICLPWGVTGNLTHAALERTGFLTAFANRLSGAFAVRRGNDPYFLKRLNERYVFSLPGHGRRTMTFLG
jgi:hypothetical protein